MAFITVLVQMISLLCSGRRRDLIWTRAQISWLMEFHVDIPIIFISKRGEEREEWFMKGELRIAYEFVKSTGSFLAINKEI